MHWLFTLAEKIFWSKQITAKDMQKRWSHTYNFMSKIKVNVAKYQLQIWGLVLWVLFTLLSP